MMLGGTSALANDSATAVSRCVASSSSRTSRRVSLVRPDGPGAAPRLDFRRLWTIVWAGNWIGWSGWKLLTSGLRGWYGSGGLRAGSRSSSKVPCVPGAVGPAVNACLAADNSPSCTRWRARCALRCRSGPVGAGAGLPSSGAGVLSWSKVSHSPAWNCSMRRRQSGLGKRRWPGLRWRSRRGRRKKSFHARVLSVAVLAWMMQAQAKERACRTRPRKNWGGCWKKNVFWRRMGWSSRASRETKARRNRRMSDDMSGWRWGDSSAGDGVLGASWAEVPLLALELEPEVLELGLPGGLGSRRGCWPGWSGAGVGISAADGTGRAGSGTWREAGAAVVLAAAVVEADWVCRHWSASSAVRAARRSPR